MASMASAFRSQQWQEQSGIAAHNCRGKKFLLLSQSGGNVALCTNSLLDLRSHRKFPTLFSSSSASIFAGNCYHYSTLKFGPTNRVTRRSQPSTMGVIKAAFIFEWIQSIIRFITKVPTKLFVQKLEADLDRAAKMIKTGASIVIEVAKEADEVAEEVERLAEQAQEIAEKVSKGTEIAEERVDEILEVLDGDKKVVVTSYKVVDNNESQTSVTSTSTVVATHAQQQQDDDDGTSTEAVVSAAVETTSIVDDKKSS